MVILVENVGLFKHDPDLYRASSPHSMHTLPERTINMIVRIPKMLRYNQKGGNVKIRSLLIVKIRIFDIHKVIWPLSFLFILLIIHVHFNIVQGNVEKQIIYFLWKSLFAATPKLVIGLEVDIRRL